MPEKDTGAWRDWHYGDEPCTYSGGCNEPLRSHTHLSPGPGQPIAVVYYDDPVPEMTPWQREVLEKLRDPGVNRIVLNVPHRHGRGARDD